MLNFIKSSKERFKNKGKEGFLFLLLIVGGFVACEGAQEDRNPFGPSSIVFTLRIIPNATTVLQGANFTFTTFFNSDGSTAGTAPFTWTSSNILVGTIVPDTGVFTAGAIGGTITITVVDALGNTDTASVSVPTLTLGFDIVGVVQVAAEAVDTVTANVNQSGGGLAATIANNNTTSAFTAVPTIVTTVNTVVLTAPILPLPTAAQGDQVYTVSVTDSVNGNTGTFIYTLTNGGL